MVRSTKILRLFRFETWKVTIIPLARGAWARYCCRLRFGRRISIGKRFALGGSICISGSGIIVLGDNLLVHSNARRTELIAGSPRSKIIIGNDVYLNGPTIYADEEVSIGDGCIIGDATIVDTDFHSTAADRRINSAAPVGSAAIRIDRNVWVAGQAGILKGVSIGENSVVGFRAVVTKSVPANVIVAGNPARVVKTVDRGSV